MNVFLITNDVKEANALTSELAKSIPAIQIALLANTQDAMARLGTPGACDIIILDTTVPITEAVDLATVIRKERKPIGILALMGAGEKEFPSELLKSGVDHFVLKRAGYAGAMPEMLQQVRNRYRGDNAPQRRQVNLLYAGNLEAAQRQLSNVPQLKLAQLVITPDGSLAQPESAAPSADAVIIESAVTGSNTPKLIKECSQKLPDVPVVVLSETGDEDTPVHSMRAGAADCITKSGTYLHRLLLVLQREIARRELIRERTALRSREERLRHIVEGMPAGVTVIAQDGTFMAVNDAGLRLMGATRLDQVIGKSVADFLPAEKDRLHNFFANVCGGANASIVLDWKRPDGTSFAAELRAVPMRRDAAGLTAALVVLSDAAVQTEQVPAEERKKLEEALKERELKIHEVREKQIQQESKWEAAIKDSESRRIAAEDQLAALKAAAEDATNRYKLLLEEQRAERESWEQARQGFQEQCLKIEGVAGSLRSAQAGLQDTHKAEQEKWEQQRQELEEKYRSADKIRAQLEARLAQQSQESTMLLSQQEQEQRSAQETALREAESRIAHITEAHREELLQRDAACRELEQKLQAAEIQNLNLQTALQSDKFSLAQTAEAHLAELSQREDAQRELQQKLKAAEEAKAGLETALRDSESRLAQLVEKHGAELAELDSTYQELEQKHKSAEAEAIGLHAALSEAESKLEKAAGTHEENIARRDSAYQELQQRYKALEEQTAALQMAFQTSETTLGKAVEQHSAELSRRDSAYQELEQKYKALEAQTIGLRTAVQNSESNIAEITETHNSEIARRELAFQELEQKCRSFEAKTAALQTALSEAKSSLAQMAEKHQAEISKRDAEYKQLEQKLQAALQSDESSVAQIHENYKAELARRDALLKELEQNYQAAEKQRAALQNSVRDLETSIAQVSEKHSTELSQRDFAQKKSEQKYLAVEKQRMVLEDALQEAKSSLAKLTDAYNTEKAQWDGARQELEQKRLEAEKLQAVATQNAVRETESRLAWISEQNQAKAIQIEKMQQEMAQLKAEHDRLTEASSDFHLRNQRLSRFTSVGVVLAKQNGQVVECNDAAARIFGYAGAQDALSQTGQDQFQIYAFEGALAARLQQDGKLENIEWSSLGRDGRLIRVQENATLVQGPSGESLVERILTDISKIHNLSEEVRRARRLESTGDLAAATVKSLKELCSSLAHSGELLMKSPNDSGSVQRLAETLLGDANRGVKHARQFLSVALKSDRTPSLLNLNEILVGNDSLLHSLIGEDIDLQSTLAPRIGLVSADRNEMVQLIGNLLASSREALPLGGTVTIETANIEIDSLASGYPASLKPGIYVRIVFSADGCALQPERRMGSNRTLVERMGGYLETVNDPKIGNVQRVYLPRVEATASQVQLSAQAAEARS